jgi:AraC-like DNA-binding protein
MLPLSELLVSAHTESAGFARIDLARDARVWILPTERVCLHYVLSGEVVLEADGATQPLGAGDFVCLPRGGPHGLTVDRGAVRESTNILRELASTDEPLSIRFGRTGAPCAAQLLSGSFVLGHRDGAPVNALVPDMLVIRPDETKTASFAPPPMVLAACQGQGAGAFAAALMQMLFFQAVRSGVHRRLGERPADFSSLQHYRIANALRLIEREYRQPWTVAALAKAVGMSRSVFALDFQAVVGESPMARLADVRLAQALTQLRQGASVGEAARAVGYRSAAAFSRAFRRNHGTSPRSVRPGDA